MIESIFKPKKSLMVAQYIIEKSLHDGNSTVTPMKLNKLVYISNGYMLGHHDRSLIDEDYLAWDTGPHVPSLYNRIRKFKSQPVTKLINSSLVKLSLDEMEILDFVIKYYHPYTAIQLGQDMIKPDTPWEITYNSKSKSKNISNDYLAHFYKKVINGSIKNKL